MFEKTRKAVSKKHTKLTHNSMKDFNSKFSKILKNIYHIGNIEDEENS